MLNPLLRAFRVAGLALIAVTLFACADVAGPPAPDAPALAALVPGTEVVTGAVGPGAQYELFLPPAWNGDLVLFMKGFDSNPAPILPTGNAALRDALLAAGYGFAWTSNAQSRMATDDQVTRARQLYGLFSDRFGNPEHAYLVGFSLGSTATMRLLHGNDGNKFDGGVAMCGPVGGLAAQLNYYHTVLVLAEYYFPDVVNATPVQPGAFNMTAARTAVANDLAAAIELASLEQVQMQYANATELGWAIAYPLNFASAEWFTGDILLRTGGRAFFDNRHVQYEGSSNDVALNAGVARFAGDHAAMKEVARWYTPDGRLRKPVITLHSTRDPIVPLWHETLLAELVESAGRGHLLLQRSFDNATHCGFTVGEQVQALEDLATWVKTGVKPAM